MNSQTQSLQSAIFGSGCFWCSEAVFKLLKGVVSVTPGYAGGTVESPSYEQVSTGQTGHAEVVRVEFDPAVIGYRDLLDVFFATHDPTQLNRQGADVGTQYRSVILYADDGQKLAAQDYLRQLEEDQPGGAPIVTAVEPLGRFYPAEDYHRDYYDRHPRQPYCLAVITPKVRQAKKRFAELLKKQS